jgi:hypothetical protein
MQIDVHSITIRPNTISASMHRHEINKKKKKRHGVLWGTNLHGISSRTITVNLELSRRVEEEAAYSVAEATDDASAHDLHEALAQSHPTHIPKLLLAKQRRPTYSVGCIHVSDKGQKINS